MTRDELIGEPAEITYCGQKFRGTIIDETKNTLVLETKDNIKTLLKKGSLIKVRGQLIKGADIQKRPHERIKK